MMDLVHEAFLGGKILQCSQKRSLFTAVAFVFVMFLVAPREHTMIAIPPFLELRINGSFAFSNLGMMLDSTSERIFHCLREAVQFPILGLSPVFCFAPETRGKQAGLVRALFRFGSPPSDILQASL